MPPSHRLAPKAASTVSQVQPKLSSCHLSRSLPFVSTITRNVFNSVIGLSVLCCYGTLVFILLFFISVGDPLNGNNDSCFHELHSSDPKTKGKHGKRKPDQRQAKPNKSYTERLTAMFPPPCSLCTGKASLAPGWRKWRKCAGFTINKHLPEL